MCDQGRRESQSTSQRNFLQSPWFPQFPVDFCGCREHLLDCKWALLPLWCWLTDVLANLGRPLATFWSALPVASILVSKLSVYNFKISTQVNNWLDHKGKGWPVTKSATNRVSGVWTSKQRWCVLCWWCLVTTCQITEFHAACLRPSLTVSENIHCQPQSVIKQNVRLTELLSTHTHRQIVAPESGSSSRAVELGHWVFTFKKSLKHFCDNLNF